MIVTIDGPAGSGKSSTAKKVATILGFTHLDTGAMYRAVTLAALDMGIDKDNIEELGKLAHSLKIEFVGVLPSVKLLLNGKDVTTEIRSDRVTQNVADYCTHTSVRDAMVKLQREIGAKGDTICEGRDMGSVVFKNAELKFYMVASVESRAKRRQLDFEKMGVNKSIEELIAEIEARDEKDSNRGNSPLVKADDAILLDTTNMTFDEQVDFIVDRVRSYNK